MAAPSPECRRVAAPREAYHGPQVRYDLGKPDERNVTPLTAEAAHRTRAPGYRRREEHRHRQARGMEFKCVHFPPTEFDISGAVPAGDPVHVERHDLHPAAGAGLRLQPAPDDYKRFVYPGSRFNPVLECRLAIELDAADPTYASPFSNALRPTAFPPSHSRPEARRPDGVPDSTDLKHVGAAHT